MTNDLFKLRYLPTMYCYISDSYIKAVLQEFTQDKDNDPIHLIFTKSLVTDDCDLRKDYEVYKRVY